MKRPFLGKGVFLYVKLVNNGQKWKLSLNWGIGQMLLIIKSILLCERERYITESMIRLIVVLCFLFFLFLQTSVALAETWVVDDDGKADFNNIQDAINASSDGDEVSVREGLYYEYNINTLGKSIVIEGAISADGELLSVVHGNWQGSVFVCDSGETTTTVLKNLLITGGSAFVGGGLLIENSSPSLLGCTFMNNYATKGFGGGIGVIDGVLSVVGCKFIGNIAGVGGGVYNQPEYGSVHEVSGCLFENNQAVNGSYGHGGGLNHSRGSLDIHDCDFINNNSTGNGGGISDYAGYGITVRNCNFIGNSSHGGGGLNTGGIGGCTVISSVFKGNQSSGYGGGIQSSSSSLYIINTRLTENVSDWLGGAVQMLYADQQPAVFANCLIDHNTSHTGAAVSIHGTIETRFKNTTIINNSGFGLYLEGWEGQEAQVHNTIIWGNDADSISISGGLAVQVHYSSIEGGWDGEGNIDVDPQISFDDDEVSISSTSPCIDAGDISLLPIDSIDIDEDSDVLEELPVDFFGNERIVGTTVDIGSIEFQGQPCVGDVNNDGFVGVTDLLDVIEQWGTNGSADINGDGVVDVSDVLMLVGNWGTCD